MGKRLIVIGAGPMGLYAAFLAARRNLDVTVLERDRIGASLLGWGPTRLFSPLSMNAPAAVLQALPGLPAGDALLTGPEMVERVLLPLSRHPLLYDRVKTGRRVLAIGRAGMRRLDFAGHPVRQEKPFRLLVEDDAGERMMEADFVFDAGGSTTPGAAGAGGMPAVGERAVEGRILRSLGSLEAFLADAPRGRLLLIGHGHSAAQAMVLLSAAVHSRGNLQVTWAFRSRHRRPIPEVAEDPLPARAAVAAAANDLAAAPPPGLEVRRGVSLSALERITGSGRSEARSRDRSGERSGEGSGNRSGERLEAAFTAGPSLEVDTVAAFTGYRPDLTYLSELALDLSPVSEGTRRLHAVLAGASDCLSVPAPQAADLDSGEAGLFLIGAKSYGRSNAFLLRDGIRHVESILGRIA
ncbi:MAG: NAD(P)-binding protein [Fibrobacteres bacterium]|nr:NAD(P)-binding protein [Fibrobacterota bacterium]